jgi:chitin disaccharide deacetylase
LKRLIVNADDFGMSREVNAGVITAYREGLVSSASVMANGLAFAEAAQLAKEHPGLHVGVHLNVIEGMPVSPPNEVSSLVSRSGRFLGSSWRFVARHWLGGIRERELISELAAQIQKVVDAGLNPSHVDSHTHIHGLPGVLPSVLVAASRFGLKRVRCPHETTIGHSHHSVRLGSRMRSLIVRGLSTGARRTLEQHDVRTPDHFIGPMFMGTLHTSTLVRIIESLPEGVSEIMCHPSQDRGADRHIARDEELRAFTSQAAKDAIKAHAVELVGFGSL